MRCYGIGLLAVVGVLWWSIQYDIISYPNHIQQPDFLNISNIENQVARIRANTRILLQQKLEKPIRNFLLFEETFEGADPLSNVVSVQTSSEYGFRITTDPVNSENRVGRFELRVSDDLIHRGKRSEMLVVNRITTKEKWYSFAVLFPENGYKPDSSNELISQWHQEGSPPISLRTVDNDIYLRVRHSTKPDKWKVFNLAPLDKAVWHEFVFHIIHSSGPDALIEVWHNGQKRVTYNGPNHFDDKKMPYWKVGVYKARWNNHRTASDSRVIFFDNIKVGNELASFETMRPTSIDMKPSADL